MSKLLPALLLLLLLLLLVAMSSSDMLTDLVTMRSQEEVPHFFRMPDKQNAKMCCAKCIDEKVCFLITENLTSMCAGHLGHTQIGRVNFPGGRMIATSKLTNDVWKLFWIDDEDDHVLNSRDFSLPQCRWKSRVRTDESVAGAVVDMLVDLAHDRDQVRVSFEPVGCAKHTCDVTFYWRKTFLPKKGPPKTTPELEIEEKEDL